MNILEKMVEIKKNILLSDDEFKRLFIDVFEDNYVPLILNPFNEEAYIVLKELEKTFYKRDENEKLLFFLSGPLGMLNVGTIRGKEDGLRSTAIYFMTNILPFQQPLFVLVKKEKYTRKRIKYLFEKYGLKSTNPKIGPNKNYLSIKQKNNRNPIDSKLRHGCFKRDGYKCLECGATNKEKVLHCDHIIPVSQGGTDELSNLQTLCEDCNLAKSNKAFKGGRKEGDDRPKN